ncbi:MAG: LLM class F420-dependent oxidoreductase, partial [Acidimicrobiales bacterium]
HCADIGLDPAPITCSSQHRAATAVGVSEGGDQLADHADAGVDLVIFTLGPPHSPAVLEPLADVARQLA